MTPFPFLDFTQVMARLKNKEVPESADEIKNVDTAPETTPEVPASVDAVLKKFCQYDELYVDSTGCVYTKDTQPSIIGGAILYKNPYYN